MTPAYIPNEFILVARRFWVEAGWWPPVEDFQR